eukprot:7390842-Prymnesium_polylepis.1
MSTTAAMRVPRLAARGGASTAARAYPAAPAAVPPTTAASTVQPRQRLPGCARRTRRATSWRLWHRPRTRGR